ncbi:MAG: GAF domain-containing protein [Candidatus Rokubacteria bacterium]|nr:GAF domain-containing protein [Candidatus Rokubacteria bacterium]
MTRSRPARRRRRPDEGRLRHLADLVGSSLEEGHVFERIVETTRELLKTDLVSLWLLDESADVVRLVYRTGAAPPEGAVEQFALNQGVVGRVIATEQPYYSRNVQRDPNYVQKTWAAAAGYRSLLTVPLLMRERAVGALAVMTRAACGFTVGERALLQAFAAKAATAVANAVLYRRASRLAALAELTRLASSTPDGRETYDAVCRASIQLLGARMARVWIDDPEQRQLRLAGSAGLDREFEAEVTGTGVLPYGVALAGRVFVSRKAETIEDVQGDPRWAHQRLAHAAGLHTCVGIPLVAGERALGVLLVLFSERRRLATEDEDLLGLFAAHAAIALERARQLASGEARQELLRRLHEVAVSLQRAQNSEERLETFVRAAHQIVGFDRVNVFHVDEAAGVLRAHITHDGFTPEEVPALPLDPAAGPYYAALATGRPVSVLEDVDLAALPRLEEPYRSHPYFRSTRFVIVPLTVGMRVIGVASADNKTSRRPITPDVIEPFALLGQQLGAAIHQGQLYARAEEQSNELATLHEASTALVSSLDLDDVLGAIADRVITLFDAQISAVYELDEARGLLTPRLGRQVTSTFEMHGVSLGQGAAGVAAATRRAAFSDDVTVRPLPGYDLPFPDGYPPLSHAERAAGFRAILAVPLISRDTVLGSLVVCWTEARHISERDVRMLGALAPAAAIAIQNARLYEEAATQRARLAQILEGTSDGVLFVRPDGHVEATNQRALDLLAADATQARGGDVRDLLASAASDSPEVVEMIHALAAAGQRGHGDLVVPSLRRTLEWTAQPMRDAAGEGLGLTLTLHDVTEEREVNQMKSDFVSFVTHQLRTPLSGIKWTLELGLEEPQIPRVARQTMQDGVEAAQRLIQLVNDLLDISRLERGRMDVHPQPLDIGCLSAAVIEEMTPIIAERRHDVVEDVPGDLPAVLADPQLLRQVLINLVSNAVKYTPPGGTIALAAGADDLNVHWSISDTGIGIPADAHRHLFEKFYRADNVATIETEGTGLGLHLVRLILDQFGGQIWCESEEGKGSTFYVTIPRVSPGRES